MSELMRLARAAASGRRSSTKSEATPTEEPTVTATTAANDPALPSGACASCLHFRAKPGQTPDGWCARHKVETWGTHAGGCADEGTPADTAARELERRRQRVIARLQADPALRYSFDVANASLTAPASGPVSVLLGLRTATGGIVTGEAHIPAALWPGVAMFNERLRQSAEGLPT